jgi:hypothetical protein
MPESPPSPVVFKKQYTLEDLHPALRARAFATSPLKRRNKNRIKKPTEPASTNEPTNTKKGGRRNRKNRKTTKRKWGFGMF